MEQRSSNSVRGMHEKRETEVASDERDAFLLLWPRSKDCGDEGNQVPFLTTREEVMFC